jgi:hypothetical protein
MPTCNSGMYEPINIQISYLFSKQIFSFELTNYNKNLKKSEERHSSLCIPRKKLLKNMPYFIFFSYIAFLSNADYCCYANAMISNNKKYKLLSLLTILHKQLVLNLL